MLLHELGHAIDASLGQHSLDSSFVDPWLKDVSALLLKPLDSRLSYFFLSTDLLSARAIRGHGLMETFADVFAAIHGESSVPSETQLILHSFPYTAKHISRLLKSL